MIKFILLGLVQGVTEFFPISSSAHLVIFQNIFNIHKDVVFLDVVLHLGTFLATIIFFRRDILELVSNFFISVFDIIFQGRISSIWNYNNKFRLCIYIVSTTIITGFIVMIGKDFFERQFESINTVIIALFIMSFILFLTKNLLYGQRQLKHILFKDAIMLGLIQSFAIIPGISRSGITISSLLFRNIDKESAFKFSFLISIPIIFGAFIIKLKDIQASPIQIPLSYLIVGFFASFISGLIAINILNLILKRENFYKFSYYCFLLSQILFILKIRGAL